MRIISGKYKGRIIKAAKGIRPTEEKIRKTLFDILGDIEGLSFLELFAGSGAVGLEAASRGAAELVLAENDRDCILAINQNIESLRMESCQLYPLDVPRVIENLAKAKKKFDLIFLDPPYYQGLAKKTLQILEGRDILANLGLVIVQHAKKDDLPETLGDLKLIRQVKHSGTVLSFYRKNV